MKEEKLREIAIPRYKNGESPKTIYESLCKSKAWFFKWLKRYSLEKDNCQGQDLENQLKAQKGLTVIWKQQ